MFIFHEHLGVGMKHLFKLLWANICLVLSAGGYNPVLLVIGTRPEGIKMMPVYQALQKLNIPTLLCSTDQHAELLKDDVLKIFNIKPDISFNIMKPGQDLFYITTSVLEKMKETLQTLQPSMVVVQGDTTTAMAAALAAFYLKIPIGHIEAGLRTGNKYGPFPEEINRTIIDILADFHFAPTDHSAHSLLEQGIKKENIYVTGNTVVDALYFIRASNHTNRNYSFPIQQVISEAKKNNKKLLLLTAHRRESFNGGLLEIFSAIKEILLLHPELFIIYPIHPNPSIKKALQESTLDTMPNIFITNPLEYTDLVYLLDAIDMVATDSGGIQEEAVSLGKPVLILRNETDRPEGVNAGLARLVGTNREIIIREISLLMTQTPHFDTTTVYGDGTAGVKIATIIKKFLKKENNE